MQFWLRPILSKRQIYDGEKLLVDLQKDDVGLRGELRSSFKNFCRMSSEDFENLYVLLVQQFIRRIQISDMP